MQPLIIGDRERVTIDRLIAVAQRKPINTADLEAAQKAAGDALYRWKRRLDEYTIRLPIDYLVTYTQEYQPAGLCHHINMSAEGTLPHPAAMESLCEAFGVPLKGGRVIGAWPEYYPNGQASVHIVALAWVM